MPGFALLPNRQQGKLDDAITQLTSTADQPKRPRLYVFEPIGAAA